MIIAAMLSGCVGTNAQNFRLELEKAAQSEEQAIAAADTEVGEVCAKGKAPDNRVFKDKPGGLIVDYIGVAHNLKSALHDYSESDRENTGIEEEEAVEALQKCYEVVRGMYHGFDYSLGVPFITPAIENGGIFGGIGFCQFKSQTGNRTCGSQAPEPDDSSLTQGGPYSAFRAWGAVNHRAENGLLSGP